MSSDKNNEMVHIAIVSGKGGVGKTSITASLACSLSEKDIDLLAADTDVDAPNLAILFQTTGKKKDEFKVKTTEKAKFLEKKCVHCRRCIDEEFCHFGALSWDKGNKVPIVDQIACEGCRACNLLCPEEAFEIYPIESGTVSHLVSEYGFPVITGETILGAQTSGKLVTEMKKYADKVANDLKKELVMIDGPPGIGCPVIAAVADIDYAIVIIEPSKAALHDAQRVMNVIKKFDTPMGVIINKCDMWAEALKEIKTFLREEKIELLGEIPLDDDWPYAIAEGLPIYQYKKNGTSAQKISKIAEKLINKFNFK